MVGAVGTGNPTAGAAATSSEASIEVASLKAGGAVAVAEGVGATVAGPGFSPDQWRPQQEAVRTGTAGMDLVTGVVGLMWAAGEAAAVRGHREGSVGMVALLQGDGESMVEGAGWSGMGRTVLAVWVW